MGKKLRIRNLQSGLVSLRVKGRSEQKFYKQSKDYKKARPVINQRALNYFCSTLSVGSGLALSKIGHKTDVLSYWINNTQIT